MGFIDIAGGPVNGSNIAIDARGNGTIMTAADLGLLFPLNIAQVWRASASNGTAKFMINSVRQINTFALAPQFGGLVIGQVADSAGKPLAVGSGVYFGEWAPRAAGTPPSDSTNLNMSSGSRTVWYVGDNPVTATPNLSNVTYNVIGIRQTGEGANLPATPNLYNGVLTANYVAGGSSNTLAGNLSRTGDTTVAINATINSTGQFTGDGVQGRFYNNAAALAGIYTGGGTAATNIAFGGSRSN
ncbi:hypothetical protein D8I35_02890 [Corticibacter populi]|uniref:Transferrin-binding protein B C-lobe/N-lobe beta barrel domain-containing protein n=1 Tax=Corticibacter populi TaxID=1550736 RepID=A0A3M6QZP6_9BURK|nr:hypothetical protein D8I35_02890 [Corticibacter populi]